MCDLCYLFTSLLRKTALAPRVVEDEDEQKDDKQGGPNVGLKVEAVRHTGTLASCIMERCLLGFSGKNCVWLDGRLTSDVMRPMGRHERRVKLGCGPLMCPLLDYKNSRNGENGCRNGEKVAPVVHAQIFVSERGETINEQHARF